MKFSKIQNFIPPVSKKPHKTKKWAAWQEKRVNLTWISGHSHHFRIPEMTNIHLYFAFRFCQINPMRHRQWAEHTLRQWRSYFKKELKYRMKALRDEDAEDLYKKTLLLESE